MGVYFLRVLLILHFPNFNINKGVVDITHGIYELRDYALYNPEKLFFNINNRLTGEHPHI